MLHQSHPNSWCCIPSCQNGETKRIAKVLNVPAAYFYAVADEEAALLVKFHRMPQAHRAEVMALVDGLALAPNAKS